MLDHTYVTFLITQGNYKFSFCKIWATRSPFLVARIREFEQHPEIFEDGMIPISGISIASFNKMVKHLRLHFMEDNVVLTYLDNALIGGDKSYWRENANDADLLGLNEFRDMILEKIRKAEEDGALTRHNAEK